MTVRRSHEERRREIADAALRIIATRGITALTVATLARELGLTGGALYRHYPSTDAIMEAVAVRAAELLDASLPEPSLEPLVWLERFVESRSRTISGHFGVARLLLSEQLALALPPGGRERIQESVRKTMMAIQRTLLAGQEQGLIRTDLRAADLVPIIVGTVQMLVHAQAGTVLQNLSIPARSWATLKTLLSVPGDSRS
ncbi:TetR/AcrR family transcriptional regulator [Myxococcus sp. RHSTA-1-4]|uniref:TetR/AcrR family transcriptional regulator n=1 Tax=Myxococcus sp. RHSTA-1-4 TaxID=2874601 RepID=UPI001CC10CD3|nr:TetR/AcrR family transcriptional regulator [Myxococcus sp. RHSTA-1-4]MBZ4421751.1 TetR/AcrR family transcriptional regulator [Myxococcus sp. RHSTA-1-4]